MQRFRKYALVVSLSVALATTPAMACPNEGLDEGFFSRLFAFFEIVLQSRVSTPPG